MLLAKKNRVFGAVAAQNHGMIVSGLPRRIREKAGNGVRTRDPQLGRLML
jgi:hypothetical protein